MAPLLSDIKRAARPQRATRSSSTPRPQYFLAWRDGRAVGRISAHIDRHFNEFQDNDWGLWGFFECEDDPRGGARRCSAAAESWLRERGRGHDGRADGLHDQRRGGLLVEGHERPPMILKPWHHPYYQSLLEQDVGPREGDGPADVEPAHQRPREGPPGDLGDRRRRSSPSTGSSAATSARRTSRPRSTRFLEVYNAAWERNWGFVPLTEQRGPPLRQGAAGRSSTRTGRWSPSARTPARSSARR